MREFKILAVLVIIVGVLYWGVEPLAHSVFYPKTAPADFEFSDLEDLPITGNIEHGKELVLTCTACHGIEKEGFPAPVSNEDAIASFGVVPPDLSNIGAIYDSKFLANLIKDPTKALKLTHKFNDEKPFPMTESGFSDSEIGDVVAYFNSIGDKNLSARVIDSAEYKNKADAISKLEIAQELKDKKMQDLKEHMTNKEIFINSCVRCHSMKYDNVVALTPSSSIESYLGAVAPDLSMMIRSKGEDRLNKFINDPQKILPGTPMPRVGLNKTSQDSVIKYMESIGDSSKPQREFIGKLTISFMIIMAILAYLWKRSKWKELH